MQSHPLVHQMGAFWVCSSICYDDRSGGGGHDDCDGGIQDRNWVRGSEEGNENAHDDHDAHDSRDGYEDDSDHDDRDDHDGEGSNDAY